MQEKTTSNYEHPNFYRSPLGTVYEKKPEKTYPHVYAVFLIDSHNTSWF